MGPFGSHIGTHSPIQLPPSSDLSTNQELTPPPNHTTNRLNGMDLRSALLRTQGVACTSELSRLGVKRGDIERALRDGRAIRPRRGWIALAQADPELVRAAKWGVILSCVTQAKRLRLWVLEDNHTHVAARTPHSRADTSQCRVHWERPILARPPGCLEDPIENVLSLVASCQRHEAALTIWESALNRGLTTLNRLRAFRMSTRAQQLLATCTPFSDSGLESLVASRLRWLKVGLVPQAWLFGHRVDLLIGKRLVLQIDGGTHVGKQRTSDNRHDSILRLNGFHVIRVGYEQIVNDWPTVQHEIQTAVAQGLHLPGTR